MRSSTPFKNTFQKHLSKTPLDLTGGPPQASAGTAHKTRLPRIRTIGVYRTVPERTWEWVYYSGPTRGRHWAGGATSGRLPSAQSCAMFVIPHRPRLHATTLRRVGVADAGVHRSNRSPRQIGTERQLSSTHPNFRSLEPRAPTPTVVTATTRMRVQGWAQARGCSGSRAKRHPGRSAN